MIKRTAAEKSFWEIMGILDWKHAGDDDRVIKPAVTYLSKQNDDFIFRFEEQMAEYLFAIDGRKWADSYRKGAGGFFSDDGFLYCRCVAIVNGEEFYHSVLNTADELNGGLEFESILYVPRIAWAKKHKCQVDEYPYITKTSYESGSNEEMWRK